MEVDGLGKTGMQVTRIGFGGMTIPKASAEQAQVATIDQVLDLFVSFMNTTPVYGTLSPGLARQTVTEECT